MTLILPLDMNAKNTLTCTFLSLMQQKALKIPLNQTYV